jgi:hypothetical protein
MNIVQTSASYFSSDTLTSYEFVVRGLFPLVSITANSLGAFKLKS